MFSDKNEEKARDAQKRGLGRGRDEAYKWLDYGLGGAVDEYGRADSYFRPLYDTALRGFGSYADAFGVNGQEGYDRARDAFRTGPGYEFARQEGEQAAMRGASASGMLASGNTMLELMRRSQGLADQEWDDYVGGLDRYNTLAPQLAGARAGIATGLGGLRYDHGGQKAQIGWNTETGKGQADANYQFGKDRTGQSIFNGIMGGLNFGSKLLGDGFQRNGQSLRSKAAV